MPVPDVPFFANPDFKRSFADVPIDAAKDNAISTAEFIEACETLLLVFKYLDNTAFNIVKSDIAGNIEKIKKRFEAAKDQSATVQDLVINELGTPKPKSKPSNTATEGLVWLVRGLDFMCQALSKSTQNPNEELSVSFTGAYGETLKPHHGFVAKTAFTVAMNACPYRATFYQNLGKDTPPEQLQEQLKAWLGGLQKNVDILKPFLAAQWTYK